MAIAIPLAVAAMSSAAATSTAVGVAAAVAGVAAAGTSYMADRAQAKSDKAYNKALLSSTVDKYQQLDKQESDLIYDTHVKSIGAQKQFLQARAAVTAQAGASGVAGQSVDLAVEDLRTGLGGRISDITREGSDQLDNVNQVAKDTRQGFTNNARKVSKPSAFKAIASGVSAAASTYTGGQDILAAKRASSKATRNT